MKTNLKYVGTKIYCRIMLQSGEYMFNLLPCGRLCWTSTKVFLKQNFKHWYYFESSQWKQTLLYKRMDYLVIRKEGYPMKRCQLVLRRPQILEQVGHRNHPTKEENMCVYYTYSSQIDFLTYLLNTLVTILQFIYALLSTKSEIKCY